jgi:hypothetical protein
MTKEIKIPPVMIEIRPSKIGGIGLFAVRDIKKGDIVADIKYFDVNFLPWSKLENFDKITQEKIKGYCVGTEEGFYAPSDFNYHPLHFFDYETFSGVIPAFDGIRPYQQVPFQYSLHILDKPGGALIHKEYLHTENSNPIPTLVKKMQEDFEGKGTVLVWHESMEKGKNEEMAKMLPEYEPFLLNINDRIIDLKIPFSKGWFTDADFFGSASLKAVAPVLISKPSYSELKISNGMTAQRVWMETVFQGKNKEIKDKIMDDMKKYCGLDTEIMVHI